MKFKNRYTEEGGRVEQSGTGDGAAILADQLEQLLDAAARFGVPRAAVIELSPAQREEYPTMVAAYWQVRGALSA